VFSDQRFIKYVKNVNIFNVLFTFISYVNNNLNKAIMSSIQSAKKGPNRFEKKKKNCPKATF